MDRLERPLVNLPLLLDPSSYVPDTVDLTDDAPARKYWLTCFEEALDGVRARGGPAAPGDERRASLETVGLPRSSDSCGGVGRWLWGLSRTLRVDSCSLGVGATPWASWVRSTWGRARSPRWSCVWAEARG